MPCSSEHMEPTAREKESREVSTHLITLYSVMALEGHLHRVEPEIYRASESPYGDTELDVDELTRRLCLLMKKWEPQVRAWSSADLENRAFERAMLKLRLWWIKHGEWDKRREGK